MKKLLIIAILLNTYVLFSQNVSINDDGSAPNANAILDLDITTNDMGVLLPRLTTAQRTAFGRAIGATEESMLVYDETLDSYWYWDGTTWVEFLGGGRAWELDGNAGTVPGTNFLGTTDNVHLDIRTNNTNKIRILNTGLVGIGTDVPISLLELEAAAPVLTLDHTDASQYVALYFVEGSATAKGFIGQYGSTSGAYANDITIKNISAGDLNFCVGNLDPPVVSVANSGDFLLIAKAASSTDPGDIVFLNSGGTQKARIFSEPLAGGGLHFIGTTGITSNMFLTSSGNLGIGVSTTPVAKLEVFKTIAGLNPATASDYDYGQIVASDQTNVNDGISIGYDSSNDYGYIYPRTVGTGGRDLILVPPTGAAGNVGIGTTSPSHKLQVQTTGAASSAKIGYSSTYRDNKLYFGDGSFVWIGEPGTNDRLQLHSSSLVVEVNGSTGTNGQVLTSNGTTTSWEDLGTNTYGTNNQGVTGTTDITVNSDASWYNMAQMSVTFTPVHSTIYINFNADGQVDDLGQYLVRFRIQRDGVTVGATAATCEDFDYDDLAGYTQVSAWNASLIKPVTVTPGVSTTINVQWNRSAVLGSASVENLCGTSSLFTRTLLIID